MAVQLKLLKPNKTLDDYERDTQWFLEVFAKYLITNYGERCEEKEDHCPTCELWRLFDLVAKRVK